MPAAARRSFVELVYNLELEGHVDTVLIGGMVVAGVGRYCGEACHGWHVWTRKSLPCDVRGCPACAVCVCPHLDFSDVHLMRPLVFHGPYEPYQQVSMQ
jgi:hypothetical protein